MTGSGMRPLDRPCGEQGKLPTAKAFKLAERDKHMSEQKSFMQELDPWSDANVVGPLSSADPNHEEWQAVVEQVKKAIRQKVLDSYRNGQGVKPGFTNRPSSGLRPAPKRTVPFKK